MKLSKNFSKSEFECKCGCEMPKDILYNITELAQHLQVIRDYFGKSIKINSAYRCESHNEAIGGSKNSQHKKGLAADIVVENRQPKQVYNGINKLMKSGKVGKGGLGRYNTFTHFDIRGYIARW